MNALISLVAVIILFLIGYLGSTVGGLQFVFGVVIPYLAVATFVVGVVYRIIKWAKSPVPFRIPTTCGQQKSLPWIKQNKIESPTSTFWVVARMAMEVLFFRSLFRNTKAEITEEKHVAYGSEKLLWLLGIAFHYSFLVIFLRHFRLFTEPVPGFVNLIQQLDGVMQVGLPRLYMTSAILLLAVAGLALRRFLIPQVRYISLAADYFPLFLIFGLGLTGILMRHFYKVDIEAIKQLTVGLTSFHPVIPAGIGPLFFAHLFLISALVAYFPFSKLMHLGGVFLSPTRNLANNNRMKRHINPWNHPVKVHTYAEYVEEFGDKMRAVDIPVEPIPEDKE